MILKLLTTFMSDLEKLVIILVINIGSSAITNNSPAVLELYEFKDIF